MQKGGLYMPSLIEKFRAKVAKSKDPGLKNEGEAGVGYSTGFLGIDYLNGTVIHVKSETQDYRYHSVGILDGCATTVIGRSGDGKSTLILQMAANIVRQFDADKAQIFIDDIEGGLSNERRRELLTKFSTDEMKQRVHYRNTGINAENLYESIRTLYDLKMENREEYTYDTGLEDSYGNPITKFIPTVYIVDSIPMLLPKDIMEKDEMGGQMNATAIAKTNTFLLKKITQLIKETNIILLCINHILDDVNISPMQRKKSQLAYLKQGERLPGGKAAIYLANNMFRIDVVSKLKASEGFQIDGAIEEIQILKSRTNKSGQSVPIVFDMDRGFDPELSLFQLLKVNDRINGAGVGLYLRDRTDMKFSMKTFKEKLVENQELQQIFAEECFDVLSKFLSSEMDIVEEKNTSVVSVTDMIMQMGRTA